MPLSNVGACVPPPPLPPLPPPLPLPPFFPSSQAERPPRSFLLLSGVVGTDSPNIKLKRSNEKSVL